MFWLPNEDAHGEAECVEFLFELVKAGGGACSLSQLPPIPACAELALAPWTFFEKAAGASCGSTRKAGGARERAAAYPARETPEGDG